MCLCVCLCVFSYNKNVLVFAFLTKIRLQGDIHSRLESKELVIVPAIFQFRFTVVVHACRKVKISDRCGPLHGNFGQNDLIKLDYLHRLICLQTGNFDKQTANWRYWGTSFVAFWSFLPKPVSFLTVCMSSSC